MAPLEVSSMAPLQVSLMVPLEDFLTVPLEDFLMVPLEASLMTHLDHSPTVLKDLFPTHSLEAYLMALQEVYPWDLEHFHRQLPPSLLRLPWPLLTYTLEIEKKKKDICFSTLVFSGKG